MATNVGGIDPSMISWAHVQERSQLGKYYVPDDAEGKWESIGWIEWVVRGIFSRLFSSVDSSVNVSVKRSLANITKMEEIPEDFKHRIQHLFEFSLQPPHRDLSPYSLEFSHLFVKVHGDLPWKIQEKSGVFSCLKPEKNWDETEIIYKEIYRGVCVGSDQIDFYDELESTPQCFGKGMYDRIETCPPSLVTEGPYNSSGHRITTMEYERGSIKMKPDYPGQQSEIKIDGALYAEQSYDRAYKIARICGAITVDPIQTGTTTDLVFREAAQRIIGVCHFDPKKMEWTVISTPLPDFYYKKEHLPQGYTWDLLYFALIKYAQRQGLTTGRVSTWTPPVSAPDHTESNDD